MFVCCVLSGRGLCDELITRPEESYRLWCVVVCDLETTKILVNKEETKAHWGAVAPREKRNILFIIIIGGILVLHIYVYIKTSIKRNILTIKQNTSGSRSG
jgi:hypothetical protein